MTEFTVLCLVLSTQSKHMTLSLELNQSQTLREKILKQIPLDQPNKTSQLHTVLKLAVGERTDISLNIRTDDGLTNGAGNIIKLIQTQETGKPQVLFGYNLIALMLVRKQDMIIDISICKALNLHGHPLNQLHHSL